MMLLTKFGDSKLSIALFKLFDLSRSFHLTPFLSFKIRQFKENELNFDGFLFVALNYLESVLDLFGKDFKFIS